MEIHIQTDISEIIMTIIFLAVIIYEMRIKTKAGKRLLSMTTLSKWLILAVAVFGFFIGLSDIADSLFSKTHPILTIHLSFCLMVIDLLFMGIHTPSMTKNGLWLAVDFLGWDNIEKVTFENARNMKNFRFIIKKRKSVGLANEFKLTVPITQMFIVKQILVKQHVKIQDNIK